MADDRSAVVDAYSEAFEAKDFERTFEATPTQDMPGIARVGHW